MLCRRNHNLDGPQNDIVKDRLSIECVVMCWSYDYTTGNWAVYGSIATPRDSKSEILVGLRLDTQLKVTAWHSNRLQRIFALAVVNSGLRINRTRAVAK